MARDRKPMAAQLGNIKADVINQREYEESLIQVNYDAIANPPEWLLDDVAVEEWYRVTSELNMIGIIGNTDIANIGGYCNAFSSYVHLTAQLRGAEYTTQGDKAMVVNPLVRAQNAYAKEMRDFARLCGLTVDSRLKFAADKAKAIDAEIVEEFGDI